VHPAVEVLELLERGEDAVPVGGVDARSAVGDTYLGTGQAERHVDLDRRVIRREPQGVVYELVQDAGRRERVQADGRHGVGRVDRHPLVLRGDLTRHRPDVDELGEPGVDRQLEPLHQTAEGLRAFDQPVEQILALIGLCGPLRERLGHAEDHRDRRAELVRETGHHLVAAGRPLDERLMCLLELLRALALAIERVGELLDDVGRDLR